MEDVIFSQDTNNMVDYDLMDELLSEGCWLEASGGSEYLQPATANSTALFSPSPYFWPGSEINYGFLDLNEPEENAEEEQETSVDMEDHPSSFAVQTENLREPQSIAQSSNGNAEYSGRNEYYPVEDFSLSGRRWWISPRDNPASFSSVRERMFRALSIIKESIGNGDALIQIWVPVKKGNKNVLSTSDQPFFFDPNCQRLAHYRDVSVKYQFAAEENSGVSVGLPGRVYLEKVPEWTPDVRFFSKDEYPRIGYAQEYDVRGTVAVPIFERGNQTCLGVLEVVMTSQKIDFHSELESVCKGLEAVDLRCSETPVTCCAKNQVCNESYQTALPEILKVLKVVCETHGLPLAQTWVPCSQQGKEGCRHSKVNFAQCISTMNSACYVTDRFREFHEACSEHHLFIGQGVAGRAFMTNQPCFSTDIATFSRKEYPLIHYARMFRLRAAVAIRLRNIYDKTVDYVLEFFLPVDCNDINEQMAMLDSLSVLIQRICLNFRVVTDKELEEEKLSLISQVLAPSDRLSNFQERKPAFSPSKDSSHTSWLTNLVGDQQNVKATQDDRKSEGFKIRSPHVIKCEEGFLQDSQLNHNNRCDMDSSYDDRSFSSVATPIEKKRTKVEKTISLQVLRQYFAGSLKDAAKSIGVCPTTLKRICRQHGIKRWPSRKIKKVGHSLRKLQVVIDSVQGAEGAFKIGSLYANFPELTSPNLSGSSLFSSSKDKSHIKSAVSTPPEDIKSRSADNVFSPQASGSRSPSSSCSHNSSTSSPCCSSDKQKHLPISQLKVEQHQLNRAHSNVELNLSFQEEPKIHERSHSHDSFRESLGLENPLNFPMTVVSRDKASLRAKVTYGEEKIRFSMQTSWLFKDLQQEISKRFHIQDMSMVDLKYLDDDSEWILLTCDDDVAECIDVYKSSQTHTIKLSVHQVAQPNTGSPIGSTCPS
ncbi:hypothetical protein ACHQM5_024361 [Ranunculus cassubicifolius]